MEQDFGPQIRIERQLYEHEQLRNDLAYEKSKKTGKKLYIRV